MERTIKVTGKGNLSVKPDTVRLVMTVEGIQKEYDMAVKQSARMTEELANLFERFDFDRDDVKTLHFNISSEFESYQAKDNSWKQKLVGYKFTHRIKVEFPSGNDKLGKILYELGHSEIRPEFCIEYTVAQPEKCKNELLAKAVADSKQKAEVLANAAGVSLGDIVNIDYSWGEIDFVTRPVQPMVCMNYNVAERTASYDMNINPDDIEVSDNVTVVWNIR